MLQQRQVFLRGRPSFNLETENRISVPEGFPALFFSITKSFSSNTSPRIPILIFGSLLPPTLLSSRSQNLQLSLRDEVLFSDMAMIVERCVTSYIFFIVYHFISNSFRPMRAREVLQTSQKYYIMYKILSHIYTFH